jgi:Uncharacterized conserved protein
MDLSELEKKLATEGSLALKVKVIPKSQRTEISGWMPDGALKVKVAAAPEKGRANTALCAFLAQTFGVPQRNVAIVAGETSHSKQIRITRPAR